MADYLVWKDTDMNRVRFIKINPEWTPEQLDERFAGAFAGARDTATDVMIVPESALPTNHAFNRAWEIVGGAVVVNMEKAKKFAAEKVTAHVQEQMPMLRAREKLATVRGNATAAAAAQAKIAQWDTLKAHPALTNAQNLAALEAVIAASEALRERVPGPGNNPGNGPG